MDTSKRIEELLVDIKGGVKKRVADYSKNEFSRFERYHENVLKYANEPIETLNLSHRSYRILNERGLKTVGDLICLTEEEFYSINNGFGKKSLNEVITSLDIIGLKLRNQWHD